MNLPQNAERPPETAITSWRLDVLLMCLVPIVASSFFLVPLTLSSDFNPPYWIAILSAVVLATIFIAIIIYALPKFWYRHYYYVLSNDQVLIQKGALVIRRTVVPFARIQNIDTYHGPLDRKLGLINVKIHTAASPITIQCVSIETGERIRAEMMEKVKHVRDGLLT